MGTYFHKSLRVVRSPPDQELFLLEQNISSSSSSLYCHFSLFSLFQKPISSDADIVRLKVSSWNQLYLHTCQIGLYFIILAICISESWGTQASRYRSYGSYWTSANVASAHTFLLTNCWVHLRDDNLNVAWSISAYVSQKWNYLKSNNGGLESRSSWHTVLYWLVLIMYDVRKYLCQTC